MQIINVYLPIGDDRLEHSAAIREPKALNPGTDAKLGDVFLQPTHEGKIEQEIVVIAIDIYHRTHKYVLPIRADVRHATVKLGTPDRPVSFDISHLSKNDTHAIATPGSN